MLGDVDTIAAISTAKGVGALSIVRISGSKTLDILKKCFSRDTDYRSHQAYHGLWKDPDTESPLDDVMGLYFSEGRGFTGEEAAEVICHGGLQITELILQSILKAGARLARPGEFTYRAVMNNKLDLPQAEAVLGMIHARSPVAAAQALRNLRGALSEKLDHIEKEFLYLLANLEASIDFTTEDIQPVSFAEMKSRVTKLLDELHFLLKTHLPSKLASNGLRVVLAGRPNAGKSSLLNTILGTNRSIVHNLPGTTRDVVEAEIFLDGNLFRFLDTAGLRRSSDHVENLGVLRAREELESADIILYVLDSTTGIHADDTDELARVDKSKIIFCFNKSDLADLPGADFLNTLGVNEKFGVKTHALNFAGVESLIKKLTTLAKEKIHSVEMDSSLTTSRQAEAVEKIYASALEAKNLLEKNESPDLVSFSIREGLIQTQALLGKNVTENIMDQVFKEFCIGK